MATTRLADLIGTKNGVNLQFTTPTAYEPGSVVVRLNDDLVDPGDVLELVPVDGLIELADPPVVDDLLIVAYQDRVTSSTGQPPVLGAFVDQLLELHSSGGSDLTIYAGQSGMLLQVTVINAAGTRQDLTDHTLFFMAKEDSENGATVFDLTSLDEDQILPRNQAAETTRGIADVIFASADTLAAAGKICAWDLWVRTPEDHLVPLVQGARLEVLASVRTSFPTT